MYYTYIIESDNSKRWYIEHTINPKNRIKEHNFGYTKSTKNKGPWKLIFIREFDAKLEANRFELKLKRLKNKDYIYREFRKYFL